MAYSVINKQITIQSPVSKVWRVFTDREITRQLGGEYITDWKPGSDIGWMGLDGKIYTKGTILELQPGKIFKHNLFEDYSKTVKSVITYELKDRGDSTILVATEKLNCKMGESELQDDHEEWDLALNGVKKAAEKL